METRLKSPITWRQSPEMTIAVYWDVKPKLKQTNRNTGCAPLGCIQLVNNLGLYDLTGVDGFETNQMASRLSLEAQVHQSPKGAGAYIPLTVLGNISKAIYRIRSKSRQRSGNGAIRQKFPLQKLR